MNLKYADTAMNITVQAAQNIGRRKEQQDSYLVANDFGESFIKHGGLLALVADGMGGLQGGALASSTAANTFVEEYARKTPDESIENALNRAIVAANDAVYGISKECGIDGNCGTTLVATVIHESGIYWVYAGDSRIYLTDGTALQLLTEDQNYGRKLSKAAETGLIDAATARTHPQREALTSYLGDNEISEIGSGSLIGAVPDNVILLLCTDGLYKFLDEEKILAIIKKKHYSIAKALIDAVLAQKHATQDNITAVVLQINKIKKLCRKSLIYNLLISLIILISCIIMYIYRYGAKYI